MALGGGVRPGDESVKIIAMYDMLFFFGVLVVGFLYLWKYGYLDWVRATPGDRQETSLQAGTDK